MVHSYRILVIGGASYNHIIHLDSLPAAQAQTLHSARTYHAVGGTGAGKTLNLARLGFHVTFHTLLGYDLEAVKIQSELGLPNIHTLISRTEKNTEQHVNLMGDSGERLSIYTCPPDTPNELDWTAVIDAMTHCDIVVISILDYTRPMLHLAQQLGKPLWIDLHDYDGSNLYYEDFIHAADMIFLSSDKLPNYREFMREQIEVGKELVVCTHGKHGAEAFDQQRCWHFQDIIPGIDLVDSNGAGDAFFSGFLYAYLQQKNIADCLRYGSLSAALCIACEQLASPLLSVQSLESGFKERF